MQSDSGDHRQTTTVKNHHAPPPAEPEQLPCPRCDSTNTKFCYYNNYNFSQPRHFCKSCRRYWTHGGTLRDIPVGGGSRKNAKRSRVSAATFMESHDCSNIIPSAATPVWMSFGGGAGPAGIGPPPCGSFTSLLSSSHGPGLFGPGLCEFDQDIVNIGVGRTIWSFPGPASGGGQSATGTGSTWQLESEDVGGDCFVLPDLAISTPGNAMKW